MNRYAPILVLLLLATALPAASEQFTGRIVDAGGAVPRASATFFRVQVKEYTSDEEVERLARVLIEEGPDDLRREMEKLDVGWIRIGDRLGYPISIARSFDTPQGRVIRFATDRPIAFIEARNLLRTMDYPFGIIELRLDDKGKGAGRVIAAAQLEFNNEGQLEIESFGLEPFRITSAEIAREKKKKRKKKEK